MLTRVVAVAALTFCGAAVAGAQLPDSIVWARLDSASICPQVFVRQDAELKTWDFQTSPITTRVGGKDFAMVFAATSLPARLGTIGIIQVMAMGDGGPRYAAAHDIVILGDDSIRIAAATEYADQATSPSFRMETLSGRLQSFDLSRLAAAKRITVNVGTEAHSLSAGQVQAVGALARALSDPLVEREVATGCAGPNRAELEEKWARLNDPFSQPRVIFRKGSSFGVADSVIRVRKVGSAPPAVKLLLPASASQTVYTEGEVDKPVRNPDGAALRKTLPPELVEMFGGERVLEFVVTADGKVAAETARLVSASSPLVASMPLGDLSAMYFIPAELHGERVRQLVQLAMPVSIRPAR